MPSPGVVGIHSGFFLAVTADKKSSLGCQLLNRSAHAVANINLKSLELSNLQNIHFNT